ncbi:hypothetical protein VTP01DRAFT_772 [Rhizomucor pusillus]|uniref:uncharacterized protein n=1 Tax=Rhizomucor pusillus TaxID=4840 RepID=UPI0037424422
MTRDASLGAPSTVVERKPKPPGTKATYLPPACLKRIFSYLSRSDQARTALTCRAWSTPALELVWSSFKFVREREFERVFSIMARKNTSRPYGSYLKSLDLVHGDREFHVTPNIILLVTSLCPNLEYISITFHNTRPVAPPAPLIMQNRPVLPNIKRPGDPPMPRPPTGGVPPPIRPAGQINQHHPPPHQHPPQQQQQHQQQPHHVRQHNHSLPLAHFAHNCRKLKTIRLTSYSPKSDDSIYEMAKYMVSGALESIVFTGCATLRGSTLAKLALTNPQLRHIEIMGNTPISDASLATLADRCGPNLESLGIGNAYHLTNMSISLVAKRCKNLRKFVMINNPDGDQLSESTLVDLLMHCNQLRLFNLSNARNLTEKFFSSLIERIKTDIAHIDHGRASADSGLQRVCLGGVHRGMIQSPYIKELVELSAGSGNSSLEDEEEDTEEQNGERHKNLFPLADNPSSNLLGNITYMPKTTVIRGSSIWWQRKRTGY